MPPSPERKGHDCVEIGDMSTGVVPHPRVQRARYSGAGLLWCADGPVQLRYLPRDHALVPEASTEITSSPRLMESCEIVHSAISSD